MHSNIWLHNDFLESAISLPKNIKSKLFKTLKLLSDDFRHPGLQCKKVKAAKVSIYECRVDQSYRLLYDELEGVIRCWYIGNHDVALKLAENLEDLPNKPIFVDDIAIDSLSDDLAITLDFLESGTSLVNFEQKELVSLDKIFSSTENMST